MMNRQVKPIRLCVMEEQEIYRGLYVSLSAEPYINVLHICNEAERSLSQVVSQHYPDVLLVSAKRINNGIVQDLESLRAVHPRLSIIFLLVFYQPQDMELLRKLAMNGGPGTALFLKQSLDSKEQLCNIIVSVSQGHIILDPAFTALISSNRVEYPFFKELTPREVEILSLLARGYTNASIASKLFVDLKTVEHHINNLYGKLKSSPNFSEGHPRVSATRMYLEAKGELVPALQA